MFIILYIFLYLIALYYAIRLCFDKNIGRIDENSELGKKIKKANEASEELKKLIEEIKNKKL